MGRPLSMNMFISLGSRFEPSSWLGASGRSYFSCLEAPTRFVAWEEEKEDKEEKDDDDDEDDDEEEAGCPEFS